MSVTKSFGLFLECHRDYVKTMHVPRFEELDRGRVKPIMVDFDHDTTELVNNETGVRILLHKNHRFIDPVFFEKALTLGDIAPDVNGTYPSTAFYKGKTGWSKVLTWSKMVRINRRKGNFPV
jgi:hypothetical protein